MKYLSKFIPPLLLSVSAYDISYYSIKNRKK